MKRYLLAGLLTHLVGLSGTALAGPLFVSQAAPSLKPKQLEAGFGSEYGFQKFELTSNRGTTFKDRVYAFPVFARVGIFENLEAHLAIPIVRAIDSTEGLVSARDSNTGIGNVQLGAKWTFLREVAPLAFGVNFDLPTSNPKNNPAPLGPRYSGQMQQGFNSHMYLAADSPMAWDLVGAHVNFGYMFTGEYKNANQADFNPSDLVTFGAAVSLNLGRWVENLSLSGEIVGNGALNESKTSGTNNSGSKGTVVEVGPTVRYRFGPIGTFAGFLFDTGDPNYRSNNYRVAFGLSFLIGE